MSSLETWLEETGAEVTRREEAGFPEDVDAEIKWNKVRINPTTAILMAVRVSLPNCLSYCLCVFLCHVFLCLLFVLVCVCVFPSCLSVYLSPAHLVFVYEALDTMLSLCM